MSHKITYTFDVEIERDDEEEEGRRYRACCPRLTGCHVYASNEAEALDKMRRAIDIWLEFACRQFGDEEPPIEDLLG